MLSCRNKSSYKTCKPDVDYIWQEVYRGMDSKSSVGDYMPVRVRPSAPRASNVRIQKVLAFLLFMDNSKITLILTVSPPLLKRKFYQHDSMKCDSPFVRSRKVQVQYFLVHNEYKSNTLVYMPISQVFKGFCIFEYGAFFIQSTFYLEVDYFTILACVFDKVIK